MRSRIKQGGNGQMQCGLTTGRADSADPTLQSCDTLFEHRVGGVADARIHMARAFQIEQARCLIARFKDKRGAQMYRHRSGACTGVRRCTCVQGEGVKSRIEMAGHV